MSNKHTPGPWQAIKSSKPQVAGDWFVARNVSERASFSHFEQLRGEDGMVTSFETETLAAEAIVGLS